MVTILDVILQNVTSIHQQIVVYFTKIATSHLPPPPAPPQLSCQHMWGGSSGWGDPHTAPELSGPGNSV